MYTHTHTHTHTQYICLYDLALEVDARHELTHHEHKLAHLYHIISYHITLYYTTTMYNIITCNR
jgi:hypothetical protein